MSDAPNAGSFSIGRVLLLVVPLALLAWATKMYSGNLQNEIGPLKMPEFAQRRLDSLHVPIRDEWLYPEALQKMNDSRLGLTASVWTKDKDRATRMARALQFGTVYMNRCDALDPALPWVGWKSSGRGHSLSTFGFDTLTKLKAIHFRL